MDYFEQEIEQSSASNDDGYYPTDCPDVGHYGKLVTVEGGVLCLNCSAFIKEITEEDFA